MLSQPEQIISYWLGPEDSDPDIFKKQQKLWYTFKSNTDDDIRERFGETLLAAESEKLASWHESLDGRLSLVILFDQFSRKLYRGSTDAFKTDQRALAISQQTLNSGAHLTLNIPARVILYHPLHHAERLECQNSAVILFEQLLEKCSLEWHESIQGNLRSIRNHRNVIKRFGRFPHRNEILGRASTPDEIEYLAKDERSYGQK